MKKAKKQAKVKNKKETAKKQPLPKKEIKEEKKTEQKKVEQKRAEPAAAEEKKAPIDNSPKTQAHADEVKQLQEEYNEIRAEISNRRKKGENLSVEEIRAMIIPLKIQMFAATHREEDKKKVRELLHQLKEMLRLSASAQR